MVILKLGYFGEPLIEEEENYCSESIEEYSKPTEYGPEISSSLAIVVKFFWKKFLNHEDIEEKMKKAKTRQTASF